MQLMSEENKTMGELVEEMVAAYPCSGEINTKLENPEVKLEEIKAKYSDGKMETVDGVSVEYDNWRFNVRLSNTEQLIRLNVESKGNKKLMEDKTQELLDLIRS